MSITKSQQDCINTSLRRAVNHLLNEPIKTMVLPLAIPTGFGKTRIAIQGIVNSFRDDCEKIPVNATVVLLPQKSDHITDTWKKTANWVKNIDDAEKFGPRYDKITWRSLIMRHSQKEKKVNGKSLFYVLRHQSWTDNKNALVNLGNRGPIFFIIDEWHGCKYLSKFLEFPTDKENHVDAAEDFWRDALLPPSIRDSKRKLFVLLVSATPIATTEDMDSADENTDDDEKFGACIRNAYEAFRVLTQVGNKNNAYNFLENSYNTLIKDEVEKIKTKSRYQPFGKLNGYCEEYLSAVCQLVRLSRESSCFLEEQLCLTQENGLKISALINLLKYYDRKKFLIFCHHLEVAERVASYIKSSMKLDDKSVAYVKNCTDENGKKLSEKKVKEKFNKLEDPLRYLVVTDSDSQGIDLHLSGAFIVHYELSWNPIRIIQRFGRVWRIVKNQNGTEMTHPKAFCLPYPYSYEEEQVNRLRRRWDFLEKLDREMAGEKEDARGRVRKKKLSKKNRASMNFAAIPMDIALGKRCTPEPKP